jgi:hypothetical protein
MRTLNQRFDDSKALAVDIEEQLPEPSNPDRISKKRGKLVRLCDVVLFSVPETDEGLEDAAELTEMVE